MASIIQKKRFANEVNLLKREPLHYCTAYPDAENPLIWYFLIIGQKGTDYYNGEYIGKIVHSPKYPAQPPDYYMLTPSGRYNINSKICLTNSSYHMGDWSSTWNISSILIAFYSIWLDDKEHGISHITDTPEHRQSMAKKSIEYNNKNNLKIYQKFDRTHLLNDAPVRLKKKVIDNSTTNESPSMIVDTTNVINNENINNDTKIEVKIDINDKMITDDKMTTDDKMEAVAANAEDEIITEVKLEQLPENIEQKTILKTVKGKNNKKT